MVRKRRPMTERERELYLAERKKIAEELGVPEEEVIILDADAESASWIEDSGLGGPEAVADREKIARENDREEGGE